MVLDYQVEEKTYNPGQHQVAVGISLLHVSPHLGIWI